MNDVIDMTQVVSALELPPSALVTQRISKKLLIENGVSIPADKRTINDGIEELTWVAALKPNNIGVPAFRDNVREYLEIAVLSLVMCPASNLLRIVELIHRAIPYPVFLISAYDKTIAISVANKRYSQNEVGQTVLDAGVTECVLSDHLETPKLLKSLGLSSQPRSNLFALYQGWLACLEAYRAAQITGQFVLASDNASRDARHNALSEYARLERDIATLRSQAEREKQVNRRVELNMQIVDLSKQSDKSRESL